MTKLRTGLNSTTMHLKTHRSLIEFLVPCQSIQQLMAVSSASIYPKIAPGSAAIVPFATLQILRIQLASPFAPTDLTGSTSLPSLRTSFRRGTNCSFVAAGILRQCSQDIRPVTTYVSQARRRSSAPPPIHALRPRAAACRWRIYI